MNLKKTMCVCSVVAFAIITFYGRFLYMTNHSMYFSQVEEKEEAMEDEEEQLDPNCLAANIETVAKMDPSNGWSELTEEEIAEVLETVIRIEARYLGTASDYPALNFAYVPTSELGHYDSINNVITISYNYIMEAEDGYAVSEVVAHEMRHLYQNFQTELYSAIQENKEFEKYKDLLMFVPIEQYQQEMENYANGSDDYDEYIQQQMEIDAFAYGKEAAEEYREAVKEYLQRKE